jgi:hypothetical protein
MEAVSINYMEVRDALIKRRELSTQKRLLSMKKRLYVDLGGFKAYFTDI